MKKQKLESKRTASQKQVLIIAVIIVIVAALALSGALQGLTAWIAQAAMNAQGQEGKQIVNPLSSVRPLELQTAQLRKDIVNLEAAQNRDLIDALIQNRSAAFIRTIKNNYTGQISQKESQLSANEGQINSAYVGLYRTYARDNEALSKIALAHLATLVRQDYPDETSTVVPIINLNCSGGLIEDGLLFKYADAWGSNNYRLAASEAGRIAHQFQCLSLSQTLRLDRVITRKIQVQENRFAGNAETKRLFLAGAFQPLMLSMDANMYLNPESVVFAEQHRETFRTMFFGTSGEKLAQMGLWLMNRTNGNFEQFNLCTSGSCVTGLDLVYSLQRKNLGMGDCTVGQMLKDGPIAGVGFACDREICDAALDLAQAEQILQDVQQTANGVLNPSQPQANQGGGRLPQNAAPRNQNGLPGQTPRAPNLGSGQQTQFGINFGDAQNICNKRRARGRNAAAPPSPANAPCGVGANSLSGPRSNNAPFQCMKNGQTKQFYGIGESNNCKAGQATDSEDDETVHARPGYRESLSREDANAVKNAAHTALLEFKADGSWDRAAEAEGLSQQESEIRFNEALDNIDTVHYVDSWNMPEGQGSVRGITDDSTDERFVNTVTEDTAAKLVTTTIHEAMHEFSSSRSSEEKAERGQSDHDFINALERERGYKPGTIRECGEESCGCNPMQSEVQKLEQCFSTRNSAAPRNLREAAAARGPIRDPTGEVGSSGSGNLPGIELSCVSGNRASGVPRTDCTAVTRCPDGSYKAGLGGASCSCRAVGYREGALNGNIRLPGGEICRNGLCPTLQNQASPANRDFGQRQDAAQIPGADAGGQAGQ